MSNKNLLSNNIVIKNLIEFLYYYRSRNKIHAYMSKFPKEYPIGLRNLFFESRNSPENQIGINFCSYQFDITGNKLNVLIQYDLDEFTYFIKHGCNTKWFIKLTLRQNKPVTIDSLTWLFNFNEYEEVTITIEDINGLKFTLSSDFMDLDERSKIKYEELRRSL